MKFKYVGPHDAVDLDGHGTVEREHGRVEVFGAVAESLDAQADWQRVDRPKPRKPVAKKAAAPKPPAAVVADQTEE